MPSRVLLLGLTAAAALSSSAAAQAATKSVSMGLPDRATAKAFQKLNGDANAFFPAKVTIHAGDAVAFAPNGFHNLDLPAKGDSPAPLFVPGDPVSGANDAAGNAFWFNGQPALGFNPVLLASGYGKSFTYTGAKGINSGLPLGEKLKPIKVRFTKKGTFTYFCDVHAGMKGKVHVVAKRATAPSKKHDARVAARQAKRGLAALKGLQKTKPGADTIQLGAAAPGGVESFGIFPAKTKVPAGTTVTFTMANRSMEVHTATTGPGNPMTEPDSYLGEIASSFEGPAPSPVGIYPSDTPGGSPAALSPALHGNGFWNSGVLDTVAATPSPMANQVTFAQAGRTTSSASSTRS